MINRETSAKIKPNINICIIAILFAFYWNLFSYRICTLQISQNLNMERGRVATTLTLRIYTILKGRIIYSHGVSGCCLLISIGNARSLITE